MIAVVSFTVLERWEDVGTTRWWMAFGAGVVLGIMFAVKRGIWPILAVVGGLLLVVSVLGLAPHLHFLERGLFSAAAAGITFVFVAEQVAKAFGRRSLQDQRD